jgi:hypothetical protein
MVLSVGLHWLTAVAVFVLLHVLHLDARAGWLAVVVLFFFSSGLVYWRYHHGAWRKIKLVEPLPVVDGFHAG